MTLQYADDDYGDNGYWSSDAGTWYQCNDAPPAFVVVVLQHGCVNTSTPAGPCLRGMALDRQVAWMRMEFLSTPPGPGIS